MLSGTAAQQTRPRRVAVTSTANGAPLLMNDLALPSSPVIPTAKAPSVPFRDLLLMAINERLGAPYAYGAAGPYSFDCSGFVWSVFQAIGINFERSSARSLWQRLAPVPAGEEFKFGTLVFFNNLTHVGIVADEHGFYHASRSQGVTYSPFNDYWLERIDGFRRVPDKVIQLAE